LNTAYCLPMKILMLNNFYYLRGGSERVMFEEMRMLKDAGHEVEVYTRRFHLNVQSTYERCFPSEIEREKFTYSLNGLRTLMEILYSHPARKGLRQIVGDFKPDIVHAHNIHGGLSASVLDELRLLEIPTVLTLHDLKLLCPSYLMLDHNNVCEACKGRRFYNAIRRKCHKNSYIASSIYAAESFLNHLFNKYHSVTFFVSPSLFLRQKHIDYGFDPQKIVYLPNSVDYKGNATRSDAGKYLLYFGRLSPEKGIFNLIRAHAQLCKPIELRIVGAGESKIELEAMVQPDRQTVTFLGYLTGDELSETIRNAKFVIVPSECYENAPMSILEAFAHGKPVVGSRIGGIPELIDNGVNGYLFEPGNENDLKEKLETILSVTDASVESMSRASYITVETRFGNDKHIKDLLSVYNRALGKA
jgi:glycosyltransferase involved in cell wall biosynthesis